MSNPIWDAVLDFGVFQVFLNAKMVLNRAKYHMWWGVKEEEKIEKAS